ncbi:hypothetical protein [Lacrimispora defluvii]|uniref:Uncharacterized protein n=1 Tax=Lacrimispora defluvii TaxID=2719233 RepID=A0ABX1VXQ9_9FIRM|nr:hypothetical protein [Lacrimispora defluvii]NNJ31607.1 hypothetical protein [Lacrimispora defluvii]
MVIGAIFKKNKNGEYLTDKNGDYVIDEPESRKLLNNVFPTKTKEDKQALSIFEAELRKAEAQNNS